MTQKSISGLIPRPICRMPPVEIPRRVNYLSKEVWSYTCDKWKRPKIFPNVVIKLLKEAAAKNQNIEIILNKELYKVDIQTMKMIDSYKREFSLIKTSN